MGSEGYNLDSLRRFMHLFPQSALTPAINGYFLYHNIPLGNEEEKSEGDEEDEKQEEAEDETDPFDVVLVCIPVSATFAGYFNKDFSECCR